MCFDDSGGARLFFVIFENVLICDKLGEDKLLEHLESFTGA